MKTPNLEKLLAAASKGPLTVVPPDSCDETSLPIADENDMRIAWVNEYVASFGDGKDKANARLLALGFSHVGALAKALETIASLSGPNAIFSHTVLLNIQREIHGKATAALAALEKEAT